MNLKKFILGLAIFGFMASQAICMAQQVPDSVIKNLVAKYKAHNYLGCVQMSDEIIKNNPSNIYAYYYKGLSYMQLGKNELATESFDKVESLNSNKTIVEYAKRGKACIATPEDCAKYAGGNSELDQFVKSNKFYDKSVQTEVNKKKLDRIKENINDELGPNKRKSDMPTNDEIAEAVKTLAKLGINPMAGMAGTNASYSNPEMMEMSMLLGNNTQQNNNNMNMLPMLLMNQNGTQKMSPELIQSMMMSQMAPTY